MSRPLPTVPPPSASQLAMQTAVLTVESIRELRLGLAADEQLLTELKERIPIKRKRLEAAMMFVTEEQRAAILEDVPAGVSVSGDSSGQEVAKEPEDADFDLVPVASGAASYPDLIVQILSDSDRGLTHQDITNAIDQSELGSRLGRSSKTYYNTISRLLERGRIVREGGYFYSKELHKKYVEQGIPFPKGGSQPRKGDSAAALVIKVLQVRDGLTAKELNDILVDMPEAPKSLAEHKHYIYNVLAPLVGSGEVVKDEDRYFLATF